MSESWKAMKIQTGSKRVKCFECAKEHYCEKFIKSTAPKTHKTSKTQVLKKMSRVVSFRESHRAKKNKKDPLSSQNAIPKSKTFIQKVKRVPFDHIKCFQEKVAQCRENGSFPQLLRKLSSVPKDQKITIIRIIFNPIQKYRLKKHIENFKQRTNSQIVFSKCQWWLRTLTQTNSLKTKCNKIWFYSVYLWITKKRTHWKERFILYENGHTKRETVYWV